MKIKTTRIEALKMLISSKELCSQEEVLQELKKEGFTLTQATLSRDMKQLKVAKAASMNGKYVYVLPNETMYRRVRKPRPGYASSIAYNIDNSNIPAILGTIAGDDTIFIAIKEYANLEELSKDIAKAVDSIF